MDIDAEKTRIQEFVDKGNYHAAMNLAISALNECRRDEDQTGINAFLKVISNISDTMREEFGSD